MSGGHPVKGEDVRSSTLRDQIHGREGVCPHFVWLYNHPLNQGMMYGGTQLVPAEFINEYYTAHDTAKLPNTSSPFTLRPVLYPQAWRLLGSLGIC